jgi:hypothetical protein
MARLRAVPDPRRLSADVVRELRELTSQLGVGATLPDPGVFPGAFDRAGIRRRTEPRNRLLGTTYSQPEEGIFVLGVAYHDARDGHTNEDAFIFEGATPDTHDAERTTRSLSAVRPGSLVGQAILRRLRRIHLATAGSVVVWLARFAV